MFLWDIMRQISSLLNQKRWFAYQLSPFRSAMNAIEGSIALWFRMGWKILSIRSFEMLAKLLSFYLPRVLENRPICSYPFLQPISRNFSEDWQEQTWNLDCYSVFHWVQNLKFKLGVILFPKNIMDLNVLSKPLSSPIKLLIDWLPICLVNRSEKWLMLGLSYQCLIAGKPGRNLS